MRCVRVLVRGRVQGVGYRAWTEQEAARRQLSGWVRNRRDGTVEAVLKGDDEPVAAMLEAMRDGPLSAVVSGIDVSIHAADVADGFQALPTV